MEVSSTAGTGSRKRGCVFPEDHLSKNARFPRGSHPGCSQIEIHRIGGLPRFGEFENGPRFQIWNHIVFHSTNPQADWFFVVVAGSLSFECDAFELDPDELQPVFIPIERSICA
jgi:hypothetical protein